MFFGPRLVPSKKVPVEGPLILTTLVVLIVDGCEIQTSHHRSETLVSDLIPPSKYQQALRFQLWFQQLCEKAFVFSSLSLVAVT